MKDNIGERFQDLTKYHREKMDFKPLDWCKKPDIYKSYENADKIALPRGIDFPNKHVLEALAERKSVRRFSDEQITIKELSLLMWANGGIQRVEHGYEFRTSPSAGALYPIETYFVANDIEGIESGIYHYSVKDHTVELVKVGDFSLDVAKAALDQDMCALAPIVILWTAIFERSRWKYKQRAYRYVYLDAGHMAENLVLASTAIGLGTCQIGAFYDDDINSLIGVDGVEESIVYASVAGHLPKI